MAEVDIDPDTGYPKDVAKRPGAPFPDERIPTQKTVLEDPDGEPDAFKGDGAAAGAEKDAVIEESTGGEVPVAPVEAAAAMTPDEDLAKRIAAGETNESFDDPTVSRPKGAAKSTETNRDDSKPETPETPKDEVTEGDSQNDADKVSDDEAPKRGRRSSRAKTSE